MDNAVLDQAYQVTLPEVLVRLNHHQPVNLWIATCFFKICLEVESPEALQEKQTKCWTYPKKKPPPSWMCTDLAKGTDVHVTIPSGSVTHPGGC